MSKTFAQNRCSFFKIFRTGTLLARDEAGGGKRQRTYPPRFQAIGASPPEHGRSLAQAKAATPRSKGRNTAKQKEQKTGAEAKKTGKPVHYSKRNA